MIFKFNNLLGFINSEEEFRIMLCLYKMSLEDRQDKLVIKKDSAFYFYNVHYYLSKMYLYVIWNKLVSNRISSWCQKIKE